MRQNLFFKDNDNILYFNGTCFITHNINDNTQSIFGGHKINETDKEIIKNYKTHDNDITCFDYLPPKDGNIIVSGQRGLLPLILAWDADTKKIINKIYLPKGTK